MPRIVTALSGQQDLANQIPVSVVRIEIPSAEKRLCDIDRSVFLNPSTLAVAIAAGAGLLEFAPYAGLSVPQIDVGDAEPLGDVTISVSNVGTDDDPEGEWSAVLAANVYRDAPTTVWQGNLVVGATPFDVTFTGAVTMWEGKLAAIEVTRTRATLSFEPPDALVGLLPWRTYNITDFPHMPIPGSRIVWGYTEREV